ncbi:MAG: class I SAM-dependent methyltransferase [Planctomycetota bacterium]
MEPEYDPKLLRCTLCGSTDIEDYDRDYRGHGISRCRSCDVRFMNPQYSDAYLAEFYSQYISFHGEPKRRRDKVELRVAGKSRGLGFLRDSLGMGGEKPRVLMVGCGDGLELQLAKEQGFQPEGYDVDPEITAECSRRHEVPVHHGTFQNIPVEPGSLDAIWMDQVLEHPKNPSDYLRHCHLLLREGGALYLGLPHIASFSNKFKTWLDRVGLKRKRRGAHYATRHHLTFFGAKGLRELLEGRYDFDVVLQRGSPKPSRSPASNLLGAKFPWMDSGFLTIATKRRQEAARRAG